MKECLIWGMEAWRLIVISGFTGFIAGGLMFGLIAKHVWEKRLNQEREWWKRDRGKRQYLGTTLD